MDDRARVVSNGDRQAVEMPEGFRTDAAELRVRWEGRRILLEPIDDETVPPGFYTLETLPPPSSGARAILATVDAVAPLKRAKGLKGAAPEAGLAIDDAGGPTLAFDDEGMPHSLLDRREG
ncbi:MAG: hypothetical protein ACFBQW_04905 [Sphingomonadaceae bacterium]